jgi:hypothetical protein
VENRGKAGRKKKEGKEKGKTGKTERWCRKQPSSTAEIR